MFEFFASVILEMSMWHDKTTKNVGIIWLSATYREHKNVYILK